MLKCPVTMESITSTFRWKHSAPLLWCSWPGILKNQNDFFFFLFVMDVLRTWEEKQPLEPSIYLSSLCLLDIKDVTSLKLSPSKRGQKLGQAQLSTASCPAPPLLHWGIYEVTMVRNKLDQVSGNALWLSAPSVLGDPGIMGQTEKCDDKKS